MVAVRTSETGSHETAVQEGRHQAGGHSEDNSGMLNKPNLPKVGLEVGFERDSAVAETWEVVENIGFERVVDIVVVVTVAMP
ncbi:hypothetical protein Hanom_Chr17g01554331 [Helianthus anomalus]